MNRLLRFGLAALLLPALFACTPRPGRGIDWQEGEQVAVAFLGYYDSFGAFSAAPSFIPLSRAFPQIVVAAQVDPGAGSEMYLVIPREAASSLSVFGTQEGAPQLLHRAEKGSPVLIHNNFSGPDSRVVCTLEDGSEVAFVPALDRRSGKLSLPADGAVRDISLPLPEPLEGLTEADYGEDFDGRSFDLTLRLEAGRPVLKFSAEPMMRIGFDRSDIALPDGDNTFLGVNGLCKGVFLGTIGQDYNPVACVVMDNGELKKCTIFYAMQNGSLELSDALPDFKDVTGLEEGGGGGDEDDEEPMFEYVTIYALDARGERKEVPHFLDYGLFVGQDGDASVEVELSPDWRFGLSRYAPDGVLEEACSGSFSEKERGDGLDKFNFRVTRSARRAGEDFRVDERVRGGRFTAREVGLSYEVTLTGADYFKAGTEFRDARLLDADEHIEYD